MHVPFWAKGHLLLYSRHSFRASHEHSRYYRVSTGPSACLFQKEYQAGFIQDITWVHTSQVRRAPRWPSEVGPTPAFYRARVCTGMHEPTCVFWANLTPFSLQRGRNFGRLFGYWWSILWPALIIAYVVSVFAYPVRAWPHPRAIPSLLPPSGTHITTSTVSQSTGASQAPCGGRVSQACCDPARVPGVQDRENLRRPRVPGQDQRRDQGC